MGSRKEEIEQRRTIYRHRKREKTRENKTEERHHESNTGSEETELDPKSTVRA